jgi:glutamate-5-semialdehyde dehydrogenase
MVPRVSADDQGLRQVFYARPMDDATEPPLLDRLESGMPIIVGGDRVVEVSAELAAAFEPGDALIVVDDSCDLLHVPQQERDIARQAVDRAVAAFRRMGAVTDDQVSAFYEAFAGRLEDEDAFAKVAAANRADVDRAKQLGRSTTRLELSDRMRADMIAGLRTWRDAPTNRNRVVETIEHDGWRVEQVVDGLGVVAFVFEGRPNVFADATGVLRGGNTVVFRIGSDALGTAEALVEHALDPALEAAGLPDGAVSLVASPSHAAAWAMFSDPRLALAVARGSGPAVAQLGAIARQAGNPVSLHGTGGAWIVASAEASPDRLRAVVQHSLDRKVCNTLNTCVVVASAADQLVPEVLAGLEAAAGARGVNPKLHVAEGSESFVPVGWFDTSVKIARADGEHEEPKAEPIGRGALGVEWEWEDSPEITLVVVDSVREAVNLFNEQSPRFVASLVSEDPSEQQEFFEAIDAPYVGDGFTRWVDGQYALGKPELGLSNWEGGRLFGRSGILSGDSVFTVRLRVTQTDENVHR